MNIPPDHGITNNVLAAINNLTRDAGDPDIPFVFSIATNMKV